LKIILSADAVKYPLTGIGRYTLELASQLAAHSEITSLRFLRGTRLSSSLSSPGQTPSAFSGIRSRLLKNPLTVKTYQWLAPRLKARALRGCEDHVFHGPNFYLPPFGGRSVVTIHDLSVYDWAHCHPPERVRYLRKEIERSLLQASLLITDSEFTRHELAARFGWPIENIRAVPLASSDDFHPRQPEALDVLRSRYGLTPGGYALFVGTVEPRKNISRLLAAYQRLPESARRRWPLILAGHEGWNSEDLHARIRQAEAGGWVRYLGFVAAQDLPLIYAGARLFVFPSLYEGFGLPVLEAMASGIPVVCSNSASLPEIAGHAAAMCDASDIDALTRWIEQGLVDEDWRARARECGLAKAGEFSWRRCATETAAAYRDARAGA